MNQDKKTLKFLKVQLKRQEKALKDLKEVVKLLTLKIKK